MDMEKRVTAMLQEALKSRDKGRLMALRSLKSELTAERTRHTGPLDEKTAIKVISSFRKKMSKARETYLEAGRQDLVDQADLEIAVCGELLPAQLDQADLEKAVEETITRTGASSPGDLGRVMGSLMKEYSGRVDGNLVRRLVLERLGGTVDHS